MGHFYDRVTGEPKYTYINSKGEEKDTTLREARKFNLAPSVTTILKILDKPGLNIWKENQLIQAILEWPPDGVEQLPGELQDIWIKNVKHIAATIGREASARGNEIHDTLEQIYTKHEHVWTDPFIQPVLELMGKEFGYDEKWIAEKSFAAHGVGGKIDLHSISYPGIIIDFKTKKTSDKKKMKSTNENIMQLAAYREGLELPSAKCYNLFISTEQVGLLHLQEVKEEELQRGWEQFQCLRDYWYLSNKLLFGGTNGTL